MSKKIFTRRDFIGKTAAGLAAIAVTGSVAKLHHQVRLPIREYSVQTTVSTLVF